METLEKTKEGSGKIASVYPANPKASPLAEKLCAAFQEVPRKRRAECCETKPGFLLTGECTRVLSGALQMKSVNADEAAAQTCIAAVDRQYEGCEWVGAWSQPRAEACQNILVGQRKNADACRSSLECAKGSHCHGVSPTQAGICGPPLPTGGTCGRGKDPLASYLLLDLSLDHPECKRFCGNGRCHDYAGLGKKCLSNAHCGPSQHCDEARVCQKGQSGKRGERCLGGLCQEGSRCVDGACKVPLKAGGTCTQDAQCIGACLKKAEGPEGICGMRCERMPPPKKKTKD
jgi:hypothetical protein